MKKFCIVLQMIVLSQIVFAQSKIDFNPLQQLLKRQVPWLSGKVIFSSIPPEKGNDVFEIKTAKGKLIVTASSKPAAGEAINWYLKYYCNQLLTHSGSNIVALKKLPEIKNTEKHVSWAMHRYSLNYCTFNYTMSFWTWEQWEKELDWMVLNGVNLALAVVGMEEVWYNVLKQLNFSQKEIDDFLVGPAYTGFLMMGVLEGWGGPIPESMRKGNVVLQRKILKRMRELGIQPQLHGFYGMVPRLLKQKYPDAQIIDQGKWAGGFHRPSIVLPTDELFEKTGSLYYTEIKRLYGSDIKYFGGDPFHEGGQTGGIDLTIAGRNIQQLMQRHFPASTWVLQAWSGNPKPAMLAGLDKKHTLIQDLFGENRSVWEDEKGFGGFPFTWNIVSNFGSKEGMYGRLDRMMKEPRRAFEAYRNSFAGVGTMPEGNLDNPVVYDLVYSLPWMNGNENIRSYIKKYPVYRYGKYNMAAQKAWELFLQTVYAASSSSQEGATESLFCARPSFNIKSVSSWGTRRIEYDAILFEKAVGCLLDASEDFKSRSSYRFDLVDAVRQVVANKGQYFHQKMKIAFEAKDKTGFENASQIFLSLILLQDSLLKCDQRFMLSTWLNEARSFGADEAAKDLSEKNARWLVTIWGADDPDTDLHEYSHREWNGLLGSLYYKRWKAFIDYQQAVLDSETYSIKAPDFYRMEKEWANTTSDRLYEDPVISDYLPVATEIFRKVIQLD